MLAAVFGGSFDPPHIAHVLCASYLFSMERIEQLVVVPVFDHAFDKKLSPYDVRVEMCQRAFRGDPRVIVSRIESELPTPSFTLQTILALKKEAPERELRLIIGKDVAKETDHWHRFSEVSRLAPPLIIGRGDDQNILPTISSSQIRNWYGFEVGTCEREKISQFVPWAVDEVIEREQLYR